MVRFAYYWLAAFLSLPMTLAAQAVDNLASFRMLNDASYFRANYENDYFAATDYYYTQGINLEVVDPSLWKFPLSRILLRPKKATTQFGISIEHNGYTPTSIDHDDILFDNRPFAAVIMLKTFSMSVIPEKRFRLTTSLATGMIGPIAGGYAMQKAIHEWIGAAVPHGWQYQIHNDIVINYELGVEKNFLRSERNVLLINGFGNARLGTLSTKASGGAIIIFGKLNSALSTAFGDWPQEGGNSFKFHAYLQPMINLIGYDATLQGGVFNHSSPYTISAGDIERITLQANFGLVMTYGPIYLEYSKSALTKEFRTGEAHGWGGIKVGIRL